MTRWYGWLVSSALVASPPARAAAQVPILEESAHFHASDAPTHVDGFGCSLVRRADQLFVGADLAKNGANSTGAVYVYRRSPHGWLEEHKLQDPAGQHDDRLGRALALSGDRLAAASPGRASWTGAVSVFAEGPAGWQLESQIVPERPDPSQEFGRALAMDGDVLAISAQRSPVIDLWEGAVYIHRWDGAAWALEAAFVGPSTTARLGDSLAFAGGRLLAGLEGHPNNAGSVHVYEHGPGGWVLATVLGPGQGWHLQLYGRGLGASGGWLFVAGHMHVPGLDPSVLGVHRLQGGAWVWTGLLRSDAAGLNDTFGEALAFEPDRVLAGQTALDPAPKRALLFERTNAAPGWHPVADLRRSAAEVDPAHGFGRAVALDGGWALVGDPKGFGPGAVYVFEVPLSGSGFCYGDGSAFTCPCGNSVEGEAGCRNSTGFGAWLGTAGSTGVAADDLELRADGLVPGEPVLLFAGSNAVNGGDGVPFGDGLRCAGSDVRRLGTKPADGAGGIVFGPGLVSLGGFTPGETRYFQAWYRDPGGASPCGQFFNLTNGSEVLFGP